MMSCPKSIGQDEAIELYRLINMETVEVFGLLMKMWPLFLGFITLVIVLAKMHGDIIVLKEKVKVAFDLINNLNKK